MQRRIAGKITENLSAKIHSKISIGKVSYSLFNALTVEDLYVEDLKQDTLVYVGAARLHFKLLRFFRGEYVFLSAELDRLYANVVQENDGTNLDFIIDAFRNPNEKDNDTDIELQFEKLSISNSSFRFNNRDKRPDTKIETFDATNIYLQDIQIDLTVDVLTKDTFNIDIRKLTAKEQSGLFLTDLKASINGNAGAIALPFLEVSLPMSKLRFENMTLHCDDLRDWQRFSEKVQLSFAFKNGSYVNLRDLSAFVPEFKWMNNPVTIAGSFAGTVSNIRAKDLKLTYGKSFGFEADIDMNGLPDIEETFVFAQIKDLHFAQTDMETFIADFFNRHVATPPEIKRLGLVSYKGNVTGFFSNLVVYGNLVTDVGQISTDILLQFENRLQDLKYSGTLRSQRFRLDKLLANDMLGTASFYFNTKGEKPLNQAIHGDIEAVINNIELRGYNYSDIVFNGKYDGTGFDGHIKVDDENIRAEFLGMIDLTERLPVFDFELSVEHADINALNLTEKYKDSDLSFRAGMNMVGNSLDNINGSVKFDSISFTNNSSTLTVNNVVFTSSIEDDITEVYIRSDYLNGSVKGIYKYSKLKDALINIAQYYIPALATGAKVRPQNYVYNQLAIDLQLSRIHNFAKVIEIPLEIPDGASLSGFLNEENSMVNLTLVVPEISLEKRKLSAVNFDLRSNERQIELSGHFNMSQQDTKEYTSFDITNSIDGDTLFTQVNWNNTDSIKHSGKIEGITCFKSDAEHVFAKVNILPADIILKGLHWHVAPSAIDINRDNTVTVHDFRIDGSNQYLHATGTASKEETHRLDVDLSNVDLGFVTNAVDLTGIKLDGNVTGNVSLFSVLSQPLYQADLSVEEFHINNRLIGDARLHSTWEQDSKRVLFDGVFTNNGAKVAFANGYFDSKNETLQVLFDAHRLNVAFIGEYFGDVITDFQGLATGELTWFGPSDKLQFEGRMLVEEGKGTVDPLKTTYYFNDYVTLSANAVSVNNFTLTDAEKNRATVTGKLEHNGSFTDLKYNFNGQTRNLMAMNLQPADNDYFWGKAYADGMVRIYGDEEVVNIYANAVSKPRTKCYIRMGGTALTASDNSFIRFVRHGENDDAEKKADEKKEIPANSGANVKINLQIEVTPDAELELIIDPQAGDMIAGKGNGNIRIELDSYSDLRLFGTATIESGHYLFTFQNVLRKEFKIAEGSTINFVGDPGNTQANIRGLYTVNTSLRDLMDNPAVSRTNVPVVCVLNINERLTNPAISFDIDLPSSDDVVRQQVKSVLSTEEMMNRQILYLLLVGKFYRPEYMRDNAVDATASDAMSFGWATLSAQINNWLSQAFNSSVLSLGFDSRFSDQYNSDYFQTEILYTPNDRLIVNGNIGYRNDNLSGTNNRFIGDVDVEYLLTESGKLRMKFYSHTVDRYQLRDAKTTQGLGFLYKEDFYSIKDLFRYYWRILSNIGNKEENEEMMEEGEDTPPVSPHEHIHEESYNEAHE
ncbi:MAG: translocation/assembly module TamB domain-containing protein [Prevotellaceae bacterium]|nr:translocation/assembly module TamB domain-containing protein [Prevotellaceae bacterium]